MKGTNTPSSDASRISKVNFICGKTTNKPKEVKGDSSGGGGGGDGGGGGESESVSVLFCV